ncbi:MAG: hypothetical protein IPP33_04780 [Flavobacteriales bacterium]|nr:hypothetical protein [Flavobacteriales bacterium]
MRTFTVAPNAAGPFVLVPSPLCTSISSALVGIGHVRKEGALTFRIVKGTPFHGDVGSRGIGSTHCRMDANAGATITCTPTTFGCNSSK